MAARSREDEREMRLRYRVSNERPADDAASEQGETDLPKYSGLFKRIIEDPVNEIDDLQHRYKRAVYGADPQGWYLDRDALIDEVYIALVRDGAPEDGPTLSRAGVAVDTLMPYLLRSADGIAQNVSNVRTEEGK
jgi:hypothetical protein